MILRINVKHCRERDCKKRHQKVCKFWDSKDNCLRGSECQYLHENIERNRVKVIKQSFENCNACNFDHFDNYHVVKHITKGQEFQICLQYESVRVKTGKVKVFKQTSAKAIDCLAKQ